MFKIKNYWHLKTEYEKEKEKLLELKIFTKPTEEDLKRMLESDIPLYNYEDIYRGFEYPVESKEKIENIKFRELFSHAYQYGGLSKEGEYQKSPTASIADAGSMEPIKNSDAMVRIFYMSLFERTGIYQDKMNKNEPTSELYGDIGNPMLKNGYDTDPLSYGNVLCNIFFLSAYHTKKNIIKQRVLAYFLNLLDNLAKEEKKEEKKK